MPLVPEHTASLRQQFTPSPAPEPSAPSVHVSHTEDTPGEGDVPEYDTKGNVIRIKHPGGDITVSIDGKPLQKAAANDTGPKKWFRNLIDDIDDAEVTRIVEDLMRDIDDDIESRKEYIEDRATGIKLLGLKIEIPTSQTSADGAPVEGMNKVRHPLLLEAVLRFQANASGEMLPSDGPAKIHNTDNNSNIEEDNIANAFEVDLNRYLTTTATEYYPDTDRMFLLLGFGGSAFKKIYYCPLRNRPVSESVDAENLIVNANATDLSNARRITHKSLVKRSTIKRMQILEVYKDVDLPDALQPTLNSAELEKKSQEGISPDTARAADRDREIYECFCELDIKGLEHQHKGKDSGLEIPYRVTIDVSSRKALAIVRNYDEEDKALPTARRVFVQYVYIPGFGFYGIGLLHILGNTTNAITAGWRELLDSGMFANFPGFLLADSGARQNTNVFRIPPGGAALVKTGGMKMQDAVMPLPYNAQAAPALMSLITNMTETGQRVGGTSELQIGEGRADAPVGTTLTLVEQAQKILNSVHKRMYRAQAEELELLVKCFREHPESFWQRNKTPAMPWDQTTFLQAVNDFQLVPRADPNTASYVQRIMKIMALKQLQAAQPSLYDPVAIDKAALKALGWANPDQFMAPPEAQQKPPPELIEAQAKVANETKDADSRAQVAAAKVAETKAKIDSGAFAPKDAGGDQKGLGAADMMTAQARLMDAETKRQDIGVRHEERAKDDQNRDADRKSRERLGLLGFAKELVMHHMTKDHDETTMQDEHSHTEKVMHHEHAHERALNKEKPKPAAKT